MSKKGKDLSADEKYIYHLHSKITALEVALKDTQEDKILYRTWLSEALKIDPESDQKSKDAFLEARKRVADGKCVVIFPEGEISRTGEMGEFYRGYELIAGKSEGVIIPYYIGGMWGSRLSRSKKRIKDEGSFFKRYVTITYGEPLPLGTKVEEIKKVLHALKEKYETK